MRRSFFAGVAYGVARRVRTVVRYSQYLLEYIRFRIRWRKLGEKRFELRWGDRYPCLDDRTQTQSFDAHYIYHPAWAARIVKGLAPAEHIDISSKLDFSCMLSAFIPTRMYDYRPASVRLDGLTTAAADLNHLPFDSATIPSLSCMHVVEHVGLGRYGDAMDPDGDRKAAAELERVVSVGGALLFVVPVGRPRIQYNAHRIYSYSQVLELFPKMELKEFALVPDAGIEVGLIRNADPSLVERQAYGCGCFWFEKIKA